MFVEHFQWAQNQAKCFLIIMSFKFSQSHERDEEIRTQKGDQD